jgi:hypothetical protein
MSMSSPLEPDLSPLDDGIPAADAGHGAPAPAEGFGVTAEEPDHAEGDAGTPDAEREEPPFRTPDPRDVGRG